MLCLTQIGAGIATSWLGLTLLLVCYAEPTPAVRQSVPGCGSGVDGPYRWRPRPLSAEESERLRNEQRWQRGYPKSPDFYIGGPQ